MRSNYYARRQARIDGLYEAADKAEQRGKALQSEFNHYRGDIAFLTQPGRFPARERIMRRYEKGFEEYNRARELRGRAISAENNRAISSDAPDAIEKLQEKIEKAEKLHAQMKQVNALVRKNDRAGLAASMGLNETQIEKLFEPDFAGRIGIPDYEIKNRAANIRRMKERLAQLEKAVTAETKEEQIGQVQIVDNVEENRTQIYFPGRPSEGLRTLLKAYGFHWCKSEGCWQRFRSAMALQLAREVAKKYKVNGS